jgi:hypothetical protein
MNKSRVPPMVDCHLLIKRRQAELLDRLAREQEVTISELIRRAIDRVYPPKDGKAGTPWA